MRKRRTHDNGARRASRGLKGRAAPSGRVSLRHDSSRTPPIADNTADIPYGQQSLCGSTLDNGTPSASPPLRTAIPIADSDASCSGFRTKRSAVAAPALSMNMPMRRDAEKRAASRAEGVPRNAAKACAIARASRENTKAGFRPRASISDPRTGDVKTSEPAEQAATHWSRDMARSTPSSATRAGVALSCTSDSASAMSPVAVRSSARDRRSAGVMRVLGAPSSCGSCGAAPRCAPLGRALGCCEVDFLNSGCNGGARSVRCATLGRCGRASTPRPCTPISDTSEMSSTRRATCALGETQRSSSIAGDPRVMARVRRY
mmetsp:Transcript_4923/g.11834  ORF Transcript_4923/g.11834 Transcript_4923/m.11834 type:complete len:318 (+) Transcript_4923:645-1598(+)